MGLLEMAHSAGLAYDRLAWASTWYLREETLKAAVGALVNFQYRQPLAQHWGGGTLSSSDGQRFPVQGKVRNARALPKYFGYGEGITFYTWSSDQFSQYGTKVISSTIRDATYVLDEILNNETDLTILEHTTDTAGYTDLVFCLFDLLGMQFSPRLRDIGDRQLYKLTTDATIYPRLDTRLMGRIALPRLLEKWDDLARVAGSLKRGYVTASLLISRLQFAGVNLRGVKSYERTLVPLMFLMFVAGGVVIVAGFLFDHADFAAAVVRQEGVTVPPPPPAPPTQPFLCCYFCPDRLLQKKLGMLFHKH